MVNKQLIKDFKRLLNDNSLGFCDVKKEGEGVTIGRIIQSIEGRNVTLINYLHITPDNLIDALRLVYTKHQTRNLCDVLYCVKFNIRRNVMTLGVTHSSNLEWLDVKPRSMSAQLRAAIEYATAKEYIQYKTSYLDWEISNFDRAGGYSFVFI